jgi:hypothetical protein
MKSLRSKRTLVAAALAALAIPAIGQEAPESLLPPGFGDPVPEQPDEPAPVRQPTPLVPGVATPAGTDLASEQTDDPDEDAEEEEELAEADPYDLPPEARRSPDFVGALTTDNGGFGVDAWGNARGPYLSVLMRRLDAPIASRWTAIMLRRALLSQTPAPGGVTGADWVAERAWLLIRMGEADPARMLVQGVDVDRFTPKLFEIAMQSALATADPAALCPLAPAAQAVSKERSWVMARAMCAALAGEPGTAGALIDAARRDVGGRTIDLLLAEKVVGAGVNGRRAVTIEWDGVDQLTAWRFGLASATGVTIPDSLFATVGPHVQAWRARTPMMAAGDRVGASSWAATLGVLSSAAYVDLHGAILDQTDTAEIEGSTAGTLRQAYVAGSVDGRLSALRSLWTQPDDARERYARLILTARAAARIPASVDHADDADRLVAAMMTAGLDTSAARWAGVVADLDAGNDGWALLAVGAPRAVVDLSADRVDDYVSAQDDEAGQRKGRFLIAALAGLGRLSAADAQSLAQAHEVPIAAQNSWTRAIDAAARRNQPATVALLAATGMQTRDWRAVPPAFLYHIVSALRRVGREGEARMIAAEAITRA